MLFNEIDVINKLKSPNVVRLLDVFETSSEYYIIQEYCNNGVLRNLIKNGNVFTEAEALKVLKWILTGYLELIHHGIVHCDLRPENIFIHNDIYKLYDFREAETVIIIYF